MSQQQQQQQHNLQNNQSARFHQPFNYTDNSSFADAAQFNASRSQYCPQQQQQQQHNQQYQQQQLQQQQQQGQFLYNQQFSSVTKPAANDFSDQKTEKLMRDLAEMPFDLNNSK
jgi:hypothetical protein